MEGEEVDPRARKRSDGGARLPSPSNARAISRRRPALGLAVALALVGLGGLTLARRYARPDGSLGRLVGLGSACGNGRIDSGEECDDGNARADDGCLPDCRRARCGDGVVRAQVEECDDGNQVDDDGCTNGCVACAPAPTRFSWAGNGACYWRSEDPVTFDEAAAACGRARGHLASYADDHEWDAVADRLHDPGAPAVWIGLRKEERGGLSEFAWVSGERVLSAHWTVHEPRRVPPHLDCSVQLGSGAWAAAACDEHHAYLCEKPAWVASPRNHHLYRGVVGPATWTQARDVCAAEGGHLVTLADRDEHAWVTTQFQGFLWVGAQIDERSGTFRWVGGEPLGYADFAPDEPDLPAIQRCLALDVDRRWYSRPCSDRYNFVCEVD
jgi:cysteine-rich repeat protein